MNRILAAAILLAATLPAAAETVPATTIRVIDGDTVAIGAERIRFLDIDAPETEHAHCRAELDAGEHARARLIEIITGHDLTIDRAKRLDRYRRSLARLTINGQDIGAILIREGLALRWTPGRASHRARTAHWCGPGEWGYREPR